MYAKCIQIYIFIKQYQEIPPTSIRQESILGPSCCDLRHGLVIPGAGHKSWLVKPELTGISHVHPVVLVSQGRGDYLTPSPIESRHWSPGGRTGRGRMAGLVQVGRGPLKERTQVRTGKFCTQQGGLDTLSRVV